MSVQRCGDLKSLIIITLLLFITETYQEITPVIVEDKGFIPCFIKTDMKPYCPKSWDEALKIQSRAGKVNGLVWLKDENGKQMTELDFDLSYNSVNRISFNGSNIISTDNQKQPMTVLDLTNCLHYNVLNDNTTYALKRGGNLEYTIKNLNLTGNATSENTTIKLTNNELYLATETELSIRNCIICNSSDCVETLFNETNTFILKSGFYYGSCGIGQSLIVVANYTCYKRDKYILYNTRQIEIKNQQEKDHWLPSKTVVKVPKIIGYLPEDHEYSEAFNTDLNYLLQLNYLRKSSENILRAKKRRRKRAAAETDDFAPGYSGKDSTYMSNYFWVPAASIDVAAGISLGTAYRATHNLAKDFIDVTETLDKNFRKLEVHEDIQNEIMAENAEEIGALFLFQARTAYKVNVLEQHNTDVALATSFLQDRVVNLEKTNLIILNEAKRNSYINYTKRFEQLRINHPTEVVVKVTHHEKFSVFYLSPAGMNASALIKTTGDVEYECTGKSISCNIYGIYDVFNSFDYHSNITEPMLRYPNGHVLIDSKDVEKNNIGSLLQGQEREKLIDKCEELKMKCAWIEGVEFSDIPITYNSDISELKKALDDLNIQFTVKRIDAGHISVECKEPTHSLQGAQNMLDQGKAPEFYTAEDLAKKTALEESEKLCQEVLPAQKAMERAKRARDNVFRAECLTCKLGGNDMGFGVFSSIADFVGKALGGLLGFGGILGLLSSLMLVGVIVAGVVGFCFLKSMIK